MWVDRGSRPQAIKQTEYKWAYVFGAVNPLTGDSSALIAPTVNTDLMNVHLRQISEAVGPEKHVVLVMDQAGWHRSKSLRVPANITIHLLPPYSPELNPVERLWAYLKSHYLSNRVFKDEQAIDDACAEAWRAMTPQLIQSITRTQWIEPEN